MSDYLTPVPADAQTFSASSDQAPQPTEFSDSQSRRDNLRLSLKSLQSGSDISSFARDLTVALSDGIITVDAYKALRKHALASVSVGGSTAPNTFAVVERENPLVYKKLYETAPGESLVVAESALNEIASVISQMETSGDMSPIRLQTAVNEYKRLAKLAGITDSDQIRQNILEALRSSRLNISAVDSGATPVRSSMTLDTPLSSKADPTPNNMAESGSEANASSEGMARTRAKLESYLSGAEKGLGGDRVDLDRDENWVSIKKQLYAMLTTRESYYALRDRFTNAAEMLNDPEISKGNQVYEQNLRQVESTLLSVPGYSQDSNPGWWGINTNADTPPITADNSKVYATISTSNPNFITHLPSLATELQQLSRRTGDIIKVKVPRRYSDFLQFSDCLVIHHKKPENAHAIQAVLDQWIQANNVQQESRAFGRTTAASDTNEGSFSDNVAQQAMVETRQRFRQLPADQKYAGVTAQQLADFAISRAIELSRAA